MDRISSDSDLLLKLIPERILEEVKKIAAVESIDEIILDVGRLAEVREKDRCFKIEEYWVNYEDIDHIVSSIPAFTGDNRSGIDSTLHRISCMRNRNGRIIGLTLRIGRAIYGSVDVVKDLLYQGKSILLMGPPGIGKTTKLREIARVLSESGKRVVIVDTSNEIAGEGDVPHPGIGDARRMQVMNPELQHAVMIEAVENHMPEIIIVDEIGTEMEARAARTIAERGVQLIATAHGQTIHNLIKNPTLSDLVGGIETVTISDEEAKRRGTQKSILERAAPPTFDVLVELRDRYTLYCYKDVARTVDILLRGGFSRPEVRQILEDGSVRVEKLQADSIQLEIEEEYHELKPDSIISIFPYSVNRANIDMAIESLSLVCRIVNNPEEADVFLTTKSALKRNPRLEKLARDHGAKIFAIRVSSVDHIARFLKFFFKLDSEIKDDDMLNQAIILVEAGVEKLRIHNKPVELPPADSYMRRLQHQIVEEQGYRAQSVGDEPFRRVKLYGRNEA